MDPFVRRYPSPPPPLMSPASWLLFSLLVGLGFLLNLYGSEVPGWSENHQWGFPFICVTRFWRGSFDVSLGALLINLFLITSVSLGISVVTERLLLEKARLRQMARECRRKPRTWSDIQEPESSPSSDSDLVPPRDAGVE